MQLVDYCRHVAFFFTNIYDGQSHRWHILTYWRAISHKFGHYPLNLILMALEANVHYKNPGLLGRSEYDEQSMFPVTACLQWRNGCRHRRWVTYQLLWPFEDIVTDIVTIVFLSLMMRQIRHNKLNKITPRVRWHVMWQLTRRMMWQMMW